MKKSILFFTIFLSVVFALSFLINPASANASSFKYNGIIVTGEAQIKTEADQAKISFGVETLADNLSESEEKLWEQVDQIKTKINALDFETENFATENFYAYKKHSYENGKEQFLGYSAQATLTVTILNFENLQILISTISQNATSFNNIQFYKKDTSELYNQALTEALENAKQKAQTLSDGKSIYLTSLTEEVSYHNQYFSNHKIMLLAEHVFNGEISVNAKVKATFSFEENNKKNTTTLYDKDVTNQSTIEGKYNMLDFSKNNTKILNEIAPPKKMPKLLEPKEENSNSINTTIHPQANEDSQQNTIPQKTQENTEKIIKENKDKQDIKKENTTQNNFLTDLNQDNHPDTQESTQDNKHKNIQNNMLEDNVDIALENQENEQTNIISNTPFTPVSV